ncbi:MAG TPA: DUF6529 family protein [Pseudonocardia sp.]|nr:DUF6529 family protein [Pseudonocardia sp.]
MNPEPDPPTTPLPTAMRIPERSRAATSTLSSESELPTTAIPIQPDRPRRTAPAAHEPRQRYDGGPPMPEAGDLVDARHDPPRTRSRAARGTRERAGPPPEPKARLLLVPVLAGAVVAVALGAYGRLHGPTGYAVSVAGFSGLGYAKAWLATATVVFGLIQLFSGMAITGRLLAAPPSWTGGLHRWSGRIAVLVSVPVAVNCLYALGFGSDSTRVWVHSVLGCVFYGAFTTKMLSLNRAGTPRWAVPLLGGLVFAGLIGLWLTSALWLFSSRGVHL